MLHRRSAVSPIGLPSYWRNALAWTFLQCKQNFGGVRAGFFHGPRNQLELIVSRLFKLPQSNG
jgi:hypothetical protein